jgi:LPS-assembly protein
MTSLTRWSLAICIALLAWPVSADAQSGGIPGFDDAKANVQEMLPDKRYKLTGTVELHQKDMRFYADEVEYFGDTDRLIATGNVLVIEKDHLIAADRADFNAKTRLGTFFNARGFAAMGVKSDVSMFGTLDPDVQFYGETIEKIGDDVYLISDGGFTTCAQANPRWQMTSGSLKLRVDHYAFLTNMLLKVKGVPALYLPAMYYPLSKDNRSTGFLMPSYGTSTYRGQIISNAFFWAINRSQDATFLHDWYSKTGQAVAGEYRYASLGGGGFIRTDFVNEHESTQTAADGSQVIQPGQQFFRVNGNLAQSFARGWSANARADYSSSLEVDQFYSTDITRASRRNRMFGGSLSGAIKGLRLTGTYDRNEAFQDDGSASLRGQAPKINVTRPDRPIAGLPLYASIGSEYVHLAQQNKKPDGVVTDADIDRLDILPVIRFPFTKLPYLAVNTSLTWRNTFWNNSQLFDGGPRVDAGISRQFFEVSADLNGPTAVKIWDTPDRRFKHSIEPFLQVIIRSPIDNYGQILKYEYVDYIVGRMTSYSYGANTRIYAKRTADGRGGVPREILSASIRQTYSTDARAIASDQQYRSTYGTDPTSHFSPVAMQVRTAPTPSLNASLQTEFDARYSRFKRFSAAGSWNNDRAGFLASWSKDLFTPDNLGNNLSSGSHFLNTNTTVKFQQNRYGVIHSFNWDIKEQSVLQQRIAGYYNAQCCGFTAEYQMFDLSRYRSGTGVVPQDRRFHFSVTLAGIGNVSNIFGALSGTPNR